MALGELGNCSEKYINKKFKKKYHSKYIIDSQNEPHKFLSMYEKYCGEKKPHLRTFLTSSIKYITNKIKNQGDIGHLIHSDPSPFNMVFDQNRVTGLFDFDNIGIGKIERDAAIGLVTTSCINYLGTTSTLSQVIQNSINTDSARHYFAGYKRKKEITNKLKYNIAKEAVFHWLELMMLGLVRGDFPLEQFWDNRKFWKDIFYFAIDS